MSTATGEQFVIGSCPVCGIGAIRMWHDEVPCIVHGCPGTVRRLATPVARWQWREPSPKQRHMAIEKFLISERLGQAGSK